MSFLIDPYRFATAAVGPTLVYRGVFGSSTATTISTSSIDIGPASGTRLVIVTDGHTRSTATSRQISSGAIDSVAATIAVQTVPNGTSGAGAGILYRAVTSGGLIPISVTLNGLPSSHNAAVYTLEGYSSATPSDTAHALGNDAATAIDFPSSGAVVGVTTNNGGAVVTWTGLATVNVTTGGRSHASSSNTTAGSNVAVSVSSAASDEALAVAAWL
jgi:hypothetical protein